MKRILVILLIILFPLTLKANRFKTFYPIHKATIEKYAQQNDFFPLLIAAIIQIESNWQPEAISKSKAVGMMGILSDGSSEDIKRLQNPILNIKFGCKILRHKINGIKKHTGKDTITDTLKGLVRYNPNGGLKYAREVVKLWIELER